MYWWRLGEIPQFQRASLNYKGESPNYSSNSPQYRWKNDTCLGCPRQRSEHVLPRVSSGWALCPAWSPNSYDYSSSRPRGALPRGMPEPRAGRVTT